MSNIKNYKYDWTWEKTRPSGSMLVKKQPLRSVEQVSVFYSEQCFYSPQMTKTKRVKEKARTVNKGEIVGSQKLTRKFDNKGLAYPRSILRFSNPNNKTVHPTQKPVALMEYLIKTYTNEGETVLDFTMGSGTTGVACRNLGRDFVGIELDKGYFEIAQARIDGA